MCRAPCQALGCAHSRGLGLSSQQITLMQMGTYQLYGGLGRQSEKHDGKYKMIVRRMTQNQPPLPLSHPPLSPCHFFFLLFLLFKKVFSSESGLCFVAQAGLEFVLVILLPQLSECWDFRYVPVLPV